MPGRRQLQRERTRDRLYNTALAEFRRAGVAAAEIDAIVARAGVARGTFYFHFPTKDAVLLEYARRELNKFSIRLPQTPGPGASLRSVLARLIEAIVAENDPPDDPALIREAIAAVIRGGNESEWLQESTLATLTGYLAAAARAGTVRSDVAPADLTLTLMSMVFGTMLAYLPRGPAALRRGLRRAARIFATGAEPTPPVPNRRPASAAGPVRRPRPAPGRPARKRREA